MSSPAVKEIQVKTVMSKSNLPVSDYAVNPQVEGVHFRQRDDLGKG